MSAVGDTLPMTVLTFRKPAGTGCLRTLTGARQFCAIHSYLSTAAKHGLQFFDALVLLAEGRPWMPAAA